MKKDFLNQLLNFIWTILCFAPVIWFWLPADSGVWLYLFITISLFSGLIPSRFYQISNNPRYYEKLGAKWIRKFVQNGDFINRLAKPKRTTDRIIKDRNYVEKYLKTISMYEKYHLICFTFFCLTAIYAIFDQKYICSVLIILSNAFYNICPIILQQYNKARIVKLIR